MLQPGGFVLDGFSGTASASHAALLCGMNAFAFDKNPRMITAGVARIQHLRDELDEDDEILDLGHGESPGERKKREAHEAESFEQQQVEQENREALEALLDSAGAGDELENQVEGVEGLESELSEDEGGIPTDGDRDATSDHLNTSAADGQAANTSTSGGGDAE